MNQHILSKIKTLVWDIIADMYPRWLDSRRALARMKRNEKTMKNNAQYVPWILKRFPYGEN